MTDEEIKEVMNFVDDKDWEAFRAGEAICTHCDGLVHGFACKRCDAGGNVASHDRLSWMSKEDWLKACRERMIYFYGFYTAEAKAAKNATGVWPLCVKFRATVDVENETLEDIVRRDIEKAWDTKTKPYDYHGFPAHIDEQNGIVWLNSWAFKVPSKNKCLCDTCSLSGPKTFPW